MRKLVIVGLAAGLLLTLGALRWLDLRAARQESLQAARSHAASLALTLSEFLVGTFAAGDAALRQLALQGQRIGGPSASSVEWTPLLDAARAGLRGIGAISVVDRSLIIRHATRPDIVGQSRANDPYIAGTLVKGGDELFIGVPFRSPTVGRFLIPIGRRLTTPDGQVDGAVVASFLPQDLRAFFQSLDVGSGGVVWVFHNAGTTILREPSTEDLMGTPSTVPVFEAARRAGAPSGIVEDVDEQGRRMISAYRGVADLPLVVAVSLDEAEVLASWRREVRSFALTYSVVSVLLVGVLFVVVRQADAVAAAEAELQRARQEDAERLRRTNEQLSATLEREQAARRDAEAASALKDQFVMTVSHELRTPLTAIAGWARMLVDGLVSDDKRDAALRTIERNAQAQKRLIEDLLDVAGLMAGKLRLEIRPTAIAEVIHNAVEAVRPAAGAKGLILEARVAEDAGILAVDPERLQQVVWNLLSNAVKFTPSGGRVTVDVTRAARAVHIRVADSGEGIAADLLPHVFERFRQGGAGNTRRHGGLGLGLAIVRNLVELHGGTVHAHSDGPGCGAVFEVTLPA